jgi:hypothetical protein
MIENAIKLGRYDWIWWLDFDTLITNKTIQVEDIIEEELQKHPNPDNVSMMFTADWYSSLSGFVNGVQTVIAWVAEIHKVR